MPNKTTSKRIPISLKPSLYQVISDLAELQNKPMSRVVVDILEECEPMLVHLRDGLVEFNQTNDKNAALKAVGQKIVLDATSQLGQISQEVKNL